MEWVCFRLLLLIVASIHCTVAQSEDELHIPVENDNQFPPESQLEPDLIIEGSGAGVLEHDPSATNTEPPELEEEEPRIIPTSLLLPMNQPTSGSDALCPKSCMCTVEGEEFVVNCAGMELTELPTPIDVKTTKLNIQNNKLTTIPKDLSALKSLKELNANNNSLMELASGSISELPELTILKLANNRLVDFPQDLKNGFGLTKLQELDLGGNDMRSELSPEFFTNFKSLRQLVIPATSTQQLVEALCKAFTEGSLETICTESCTAKTFDCTETKKDDPLDEFIDSSLFNLLSLGSAIVSKENTSTLDADPAPPNIVYPPEPVNNEPAAKDNQRSAQQKSDSNIPVETTTDVKVGATTSNSGNGGVSKSVIGIIVAGMVVIVAAIVIKKNWSSIRQRFSSNPRNANQHTTGNTNGAVPEEVPLQEKLPV